MIVYLVIIVVSLFTVYKASVAYNTFIDNNIPVYDGVTYEKKQIEQFIRFKDNFSLWKRKSEIRYQLANNVVDGGFVSMLILVNPAWLSNDWDILLRSFVCVLIFSFTIYHWLKYKTESIIIRLLIIILSFQLPLFYNERYGLATYIADIPSALLLLSGYLNILIFTRNKSIGILLYGMTLMAMPVLFRLNFIVYSMLFLFPLFFLVFKHLKEFSVCKKSILIIYSMSLLFVTLLYFSQYLEYFLYYIAPEVSWEGHGDFYNSILYFFKNLHQQIGIIGLFIIMFVIVILNINYTEIIDRNRRFQYFYWHPILVMFTLIILLNQAVNVPHVITILSLSLIIGFFSLRLKFLKLYFLKIKSIIIISVLLIVCSNYLFSLDLKKIEKTKEEYIASKNTADFIAEVKSLNTDFKYLSFTDDVAEIPIDIYVFKKRNIYLRSQDHFYYHKMGWYQVVSKTYNLDSCVDHYINKIDNQDFDLILMDEGVNKDLEQYPFSKSIHTKVRSYLLKSPNYKVVHTERTKLNGEIRYYAKVIK